MGLNPVLAMFIGIIVMMALIILNKLHPFPSLIISAILIAVLAMPFGPEGNQVGTLVDCVKTVTTGFGDRNTRLNSSHIATSRMPSSA